MKIGNLFNTWTPATGELARPYIIAEAGVNHEGSMDTAIRLIREAAEGGAHAIKFQTYKAGKLASRHSPSYWDRTKEAASSQFELFSRYDNFGEEEYLKLKKACDDHKIEFLSTPFDVDAADFLDKMMDVVKISSSDITNLPFIDFLCRFKKPIILSTGASHLWEIERAVEVIRKHGNPLSLMHCVLNYPTSDEDANLGMILHLREKFPDAMPGYSDHTLPGEMDVLKNAVLLGAVVLEKHFTHDKSLPGNDHYHAMDMHDLKKFQQDMERLFMLLGSFKKAPVKGEDAARRNARRSLVAAKAISSGSVIEASDLTWKRPAAGISPMFFDEVVGKKAAADIAPDDILTWQSLQ